MVRLCQEFGWTPHQVRGLPVVDVQRLVVILNELQRASAVVAMEDDATTIVITDD
jgi:hypothetical protein